MKKLIFLSLILFTVLTIYSCSEEAGYQTPTTDDIDLVSRSNNGNGSDFQLNIIGVDKDKEADMDNNNGRRIFVRLYGGETVTNPGGKWKEGQGFDDLDKINKILLTKGDFAVLDANATDSDGAEFQLPDPEPNDDDVASYRVVARALGTPGGKATLTTCAEETFDETTDIWCGSNGIEIEREKGKPKPIDVTANLLKMTITVDPDDDPELAACLGYEDTDADDPAVSVDVWLFDDCFQNYFWNYNNNGLKLLQLRFKYVE